MTVEDHEIKGGYDFYDLCTFIHHDKYFAKIWTMCHVCIL